MSQLTFDIPQTQERQRHTTKNRQYSKQIQALLNDLRAAEELRARGAQARRSASSILFTAPLAQLVSARSCCAPSWI